MKGYHGNWKALTWANKQRLIIAIGEWHQEAYKERNKSFPAALTSDFFRRPRSSDNSEDVSKIIFKACDARKQQEKMDYISKGN